MLASRTCWNFSLESGHFSNAFYGRQKKLIYDDNFITVRFYIGMKINIVPNIVKHIYCALFTQMTWSQTMSVRWTRIEIGFFFAGNSIKIRILTRLSTFYQLRRATHIFLNGNNFFFLNICQIRIAIKRIIYIERITYNRKHTFKYYFMG